MPSIRIKSITGPIREKTTVKNHEFLFTRVALQYF
jgi:hypothetical protein